MIPEGENWSSKNRNVMSGIGSVFSAPFLITLGIIAAPVIILPILLYIFDAITFKRYVGTNLISVDPKGFSTNDLFLLNTKQCAEGCQMAKIEVKDQGCLNVVNTANITLPIIGQEEIACAAENLLVTAAAQSTPKQDSLLKIIQIQEYHDVTGLNDANEIN